MARIHFTCKEKECQSEMVIDIEKGTTSAKAVCLECGEPHVINLHIAHPKGSSKTYRKESWLNTEYIVKGRSMADIASECAVSPMTIFKWLKTHGIKTRSVGRRD